MQNIIAVNFEIESEGYQAITELRKIPITAGRAVLEMALVKRSGEKLEVCDSFNSGAHTSDDTLKGGMIGSLVGILGGPIGVLLGGSAGILTGSLIDADDAIDDASLIETVAGKMADGAISLIILAEEEDESELDRCLGVFRAEIIRFDAAVIADEVEEMREMQKEMERQAREKLHETKKAENKAKIEAKRAEIAARFEAFKAGFKK